MSELPTTELDPALAAELLHLVPLEPTEQQARQWARRTADSWAAALSAEGAAGEEQRRRVETFLTALAQLPPRTGTAWRVVFLLDPDTGATIFDVALVAPDPAVSLTDLVTAGAPGALGRQLVPFERSGVTGLQAVAFDVEGEPGAPERDIHGAARIAVTRDLPGFGPCHLVALTETRHLESMAMSLVPMQQLLTSEAAAAFAAGASPDPSGESA